MGLHDGRSRFTLDRALKAWPNRPMPCSTLDQAYALTSPEDCLRLYADWADSYDEGFAKGMDYVLPAQVARAFVDAGGAGPVLDVGAGTGLAAQALRGLGFSQPIDALDLSEAMLARARAKGLYRALHLADLTRPPLPCSGYGGVISSGTFTHGHVGPEGVPPLIDAALPGALFVLSVNDGIWQARGFAQALCALSPVIEGLAAPHVPIYGTNASAAHAGDRARLVTFRKKKA